jgi:carbohydrate kinase (thermoresistant glucokinase family)
MSAQPVLVVMGVSGTGKSTVASVLAQRLHWEFAEGDDMHPPANVAKMAAGLPLDDADRWPWLERIAAWIHQHVAAGRPGVITCSALRRSYRNVLRGDNVMFVHLSGSFEEIHDRLAARHGHFMPTSLLRSQFDTLEPLDRDENGVVVDVGPPAADVANAVIQALGLTEPPP